MTYSPSMGRILTSSIVGGVNTICTDDKGFLVKDPIFECAVFKLYGSTVTPFDPFGLINDIKDHFEMGQINHRLCAWIHRYYMDDEKTLSWMEKLE